MASRSFMPPAYLTTASSTASSSSSRRPSFARTSSSSTAHSNNSDDSFIATIKSLGTNDQKESEFGSFGSHSGGVSPRCHAPGAGTSRPQFFDDTPGRKRSDPIAIQIPAKNSSVTVYTPLSARGDLPGGYFPNHEPTQKQYTPHPFSKQRKTPSPPTMSNTSSVVASPTDITPRGPASLAFQPSLPVPETMSIPKGKYHPSNYKIVSPATTTSVPGPPTSLEIPSAKRKNRPHHERRTSDVKRKIQQYQREMIAQARLASTNHGGSSRAKPDSPKLLPLGSPGPITPFELEESAGYIVAGARAGGLGLEREREMVGRMIRQEERRIGNQDGSGSPVLI